MQGTLRIATVMCFPLEMFPFLPCTLVPTLPFIRAASKATLNPDIGNPNRVSECMIVERPVLNFALATDTFIRGKIRLAYLG